MKESLEFYNQFDKRLISDYVYGNKRLVNAIINLGRFIPENSNRILDVGCGLGWSSNEFAKAFPNSIVVGLDLSPVLIKTASKLFGSKDNLIFKTYDLTKGLPNERIDAIVMIDVYEHIPLNRRSDFHSSIKSVINEQGRLILACPSKYHQDYLKRNNPKGLQPVDEDVDFNTIHNIANEIDGEVIFFEYQNIWNTYDYFYAVIELNPIYGSNLKKIKGDHLKLETQNNRVQRVQSQLGIHYKIERKKKYFKRLKLILKRLINKIRK